MIIKLISTIVSIYILIIGYNFITKQFNYNSYETSFRNIESVNVPETKIISHVTSKPLCEGKSDLTCIVNKLTVGFN